MAIDENKEVRNHHQAEKKNTVWASALLRVGFPFAGVVLGFALGFVVLH